MSTQRTVSVGLIANVNNYVAGMERAALATRKTAAAAVGSEKQLHAQGEAFTKVGTIALGAGALAAAGLALVIKASADYGAKMAQLQTLSHASADEMKQLSDAAMTVGAAYGYSATQVADAEIELTKAGVTVQAQLGGALKGALSLAAAGQMNVADATTIATVAMTQFGLKASDVPHLADLMSAGADKALGSVADLGEGLKNGGLQAHNMGLSIDDTVGVLAAFANQGILGAEAGTQLRSMFLRLQNPAAAAKKTLDEYGISINDASGKFVGITKFAGELHDKLGGLSQAQRNAALATVFGSHAIVGATALYQYGAKGIGDWIKAVNDSGFANAQASGKLNSLTGDVQKLSAAFQTDLIKAGTDASGALRGVVQTGTNLLEFLGGLPQPLKDAGVETTVLVAGVGLLGGAALIAVPKVLAFKAAMEDANISGKGLGKTLGKGGAVIIGLSAITAGFAAMGQVGVANTQQVEQAGVNIQRGWKGVDTVFKSAGSALDSGKGLKASLDELGDGGAFASAAGPKWLDAATSLLTFGLAGTHLADVYKTNEGTFDAMGQQLAGLAKTNYSAASSSFSSLVSKYHLGADETKNLLRTMPAYREELIALAGKAHVTASEQNLVNIAQGKGSAASRVAAAAAADAASAADKQASELANLTGSGNDATTSMKNLHDALAGLGSTQLDARSAERAFQQAIDDATAAMQKNGNTAIKHGTELEIDTQKGRDNAAALDTIATAARDSAAAIVNNGGTAQAAAKKVADGRAAYIKTAEGMGLTKDAANRLADSIHLIPKDVVTAVKITGAGAAQDAITSVLGNLRALDGKKSTVYIDTVTSMQSANISKGLQFRAAGGSIQGSGPKGVDSVPAVLAPGEHVLTAKDVDKMGGQSGVYAFRAALHMASGGAVAVGSAASAVDRAKRALENARTARARASAQQNLVTAQSHLNATLQQAREDFVSTQRRATTANPIDPMSYVDQLRSMSRDTNWSSSRRRTFDRAANQYEASMVRLATKADAAATKLSDLKSASAQMKSSIASAIAGGYQASSAGSVARASGWATANGVRYQTYTSGVTAASLAAYYHRGATSTRTFAGQLKALAGRKVNGALIAEIAGYGVEQGGPIAAAILSASTSELATINAGYAAIQSNAATAGGTVANANYAALIASQQKTTAALQKQLASDAEKLRKLIAQAFGLKGYAGGTDSAAPGFHLVGEHGPELLRFRGGEQVYTHRQTQSLIHGSSHGGSAGRPTQLEVRLPESMRLIDADDQLLGTFRVEAGKVATHVLNSEMTAGGVHLIGIV